MTKPTTVAALAVVICTPALISFAAGNLSPFSLALWYLGALILVGTGANVISRVISHYSLVNEKAPDNEEGEDR